MEAQKGLSMDFPNPKEYEFPELILVGDYYYLGSDVIAYGGELSVERLWNAYRQGIFPWPHEGVPLPWFCPRRRAVLEFADFRPPRSLLKEWRKRKFTFTIDHAFPAVMRACAETPRPDQMGTWITPEFERAYSELHAAGYAHSVEVWDGAALVGGLYGVDAGGVFTGESMFYRQPNASKLAILFLIDHLRARGATWLDIQVMTPHFAALGAKEIDRAGFLAKLEETQDNSIVLF
jgi:leucyl/phenylalanyl-tRNA--protein transferase